jgi:hypothetical protein
MYLEATKGSKLISKKGLRDQAEIPTSSERKKKKGTVMIKRKSIVNKSCVCSEDLRQCPLHWQVSNHLVILLSPTKE